MSDFIHKPQKLASALYLVTSFFDDKEPLKWKLRSLSSDLVSFGVLMKDNISQEREATALKTRSLILEIVNLLSVAKNVGLVSDTNHSLLEQEFLKYLNTFNLPSGMEETSGQAVLSTKFFDSEVKEIKQIESPRKAEASTVKDKPNYGLLDPIDKGHLIMSKSPKSENLKEFGAVSVKKNSRQSIIIGVLKRKKEIMIKDVSPLIHGCSEKTIQRELLAMVHDGVLKKIGEKRWSRYSLA